MTAPNNIKHISDDASTVDFNPSGTNFPPVITNVQKALQSLAGYCIQENGLPAAETGQAGTVVLATAEDMNAGTHTTKVPSVKVVFDFVKKPLATETAPGTIEIASIEEAKAGTARDRAITPSTLNGAFTAWNATVSRPGTARVATTAQARTGADDNVIMTPLKVKQAIDSLVAPVATATESNKGVVQLATTAQVQAGTIREGFAISPYQFAQARGTGTAYGTFKAAQTSDMSSLNAQDKAVTPWVLGQTKGSVGRFGLVELVTDKVGGKPNAALSANANVLSTTGGDMTGTIKWTTKHGVRWEYNTDAAWITFLSDGDSDPNTRMEFGISDNNTEYFRWINNATAGGGPYEMMRLRPSTTGRAHKSDLVVNGYIYTNGVPVYSPIHKPTPGDIGAMLDSWGATQITGFLNWYDYAVDWECPHHCVMVGVYSHHHDHYEDRQFRYKYKRIG